MSEWQSSLQHTLNSCPCKVLSCLVHLIGLHPWMSAFWSPSLSLPISRRLCTSMPAICFTTWFFFPKNTKCGLWTCPHIWLWLSFKLPSTSHVNFDFLRGWLWHCRVEYAALVCMTMSCPLWDCSKFGLPNPPENCTVEKPFRLLQW